MFIEIEETVCFLAAFLYGKIPRSRVDAFSENLANGLVDRIYIGSRPVYKLTLVVNEHGCGDAVVHRAAADAFLNVEVMLSLLPSALVIEIKQGSVHVLSGEATTRCIFPVTNESPPIPMNKSGDVREMRDFRELRPLSSERRRGVPQLSRVQAIGGNGSPSSTRCGPIDGRRRPQFHVEFALPSGLERDERAVPRPYFEVQHEEQIYTAQAFAATRFGSTKLKTYQGGLDSACGSHPFTMPSVYAYLQLLVFLNAIACLNVLPRDEDDCDEGDQVSRDVTSSAVSVTGSESGKDCESADLSTGQLIKRKHRENFASGDSNDSGAFCDGSNISVASGVSDLDAN